MLLAPRAVELVGLPRAHPAFDGAKVEQFVELTPTPTSQLPTLRMAGVANGPEEVLEPTYAADVFGRRIARAGRARRSISVIRVDGLHEPDVVPLAITIVVEVTRLARARKDVAQEQPRGVDPPRSRVDHAPLTLKLRNLTRVHNLDVLASRTQLKAVEVVVLPEKRGLDGIVQIRKRDGHGEHDLSPAGGSWPGLQLDAELEGSRADGPLGEKNVLPAGTNPRLLQPRDNLLSPPACLVREIGRLGPMARRDEALRVQAVDDVPVVALPRPTNRATRPLLLPRGEVEHGKREVMEQIVATHGGPRRRERLDASALAGRSPRRRKGGSTGHQAQSDLWISQNSEISRDRPPNAGPSAKSRDICGDVYRSKQPTFRLISEFRDISLNSEIF